MQGILAHTGAIISLMLGLMAVLSPTTVEKMVSIKAIGKNGTSEIRATYGGFFMGIASYAIFSQAPDAFVALGLGWIFAAVLRLLSLFQGYFTTKNLAGVAFEAAIGMLCLAKPLYAVLVR